MMPRDAEPMAELSFEAEVVRWRGPSPYFFAVLPPEAAAGQDTIARDVVISASRC